MGGRASKNQIKRLQKLGLASKPKTEPDVAKQYCKNCGAEVVSGSPYYCRLDCLDASQSDTSAVPHGGLDHA